MKSALTGRALACAAVLLLAVTGQAMAQSAALADKTEGWTSGNCGKVTDANHVRDAGFGCAGGTITGVKGLTVAPLSGSFFQGLNISQTGTNTLSVAGPLAYNSITVHHSAGVSGSPGNTIASALNVNLLVGGAFLGGQPMTAGLYATKLTSGGAVATADKIGLIGAAEADVTDTSGSGFYGLNAVTSIATGVNVNRAVGEEADLILNTGATASYRYGYSAVNEGVGQASTLDSAYIVGNIGGTAGAFQKGFTLSSSLGFAPLATTGDVFYADAAQTVANVLNFNNLTVTGNILKFPNATLSGAGGLVLAQGLTTTGNSAAPGSGGATYGSSANGGAVIQGYGANFDLNLNNFTGQDVCDIPHGTRNLECTNILLAGAAPTAGGSQIALGGTTAAASNCGSLPGSVGCLVINVFGTTRYIPYW